MKIVKNRHNDLGPSFPKKITCPHCGSELILESEEDVSGERGSQYNEPYTNLYLSCPCCHNTITFALEDFTDTEISKICVLTYKRTQK